MNAIKFLSTPSARRATQSPSVTSSAAIRFLSTPSARRATQGNHCRHGGRKISIHALREEGDKFGCHLRFLLSLFLSTPSARRATALSDQEYKAVIISIHALREEGDKATVTGLSRVLLFLSTPSARRATSESLPPVRLSIFLSTPSARRATGGRALRPLFRGISIHALREEGDAASDGDGDLIRISIHALREEGDELAALEQSNAELFLSTPSARRATQHLLSCTLQHVVFLSTPSARRATKPVSR